MAVIEQKFEADFKILSALKSEADYNAAVAEVERLFGAEPGSANAERFTHLATLIETYEKQFHFIGPPMPFAATQYEAEKSRT